MTWTAIDPETEELLRAINPDAENIARALDRLPDYRVLRRFVPPDAYLPNLHGKPLLAGAFLDTETTGLDTDSAKVIALALVLFNFDADGLVYGEPARFQWLEDPGEPLSPEIIEITGLTDADLKGQRIEDRIVTPMIRGADLVISHNARFDRPVLERRLPVFAERRWGCSWADIPWRKLGHRRAGLDLLLLNVAHLFHEGHRAVDDALAGLHLLTYTPTDDLASVPPVTYLSYLLESLRHPRVQLRVDPPRGHNHKLKAREYRAHYVNGKFQFWWREVRAEDIPAEEAWLIHECQTDPRDIKHVRLSGFTRYSARALNLPIARRRADAPADDLAAERGEVPSEAPASQAGS